MWSFPGPEEGEHLFRLHTRRDDSSLTIQVEGRLDERSGSHLLDVVRQLSAYGDTVTIDLTLLSSLDPDGAANVSDSVRAIGAIGGTPALRLPNERFGELFHSHDLPGTTAPQPTTLARPGDGKTRSPR
ncbi:MAG TPA: hypothetical protein VFS66_13115 [Acidimicrobiia bacterium]|nr:hypothetical protein [Acidimicrobiia bacterium]